MASRPLGTRVRDVLLPPSQRRTLPELLDELSLARGDRAAKVSAFWTLLLLSAVIASCGLLAGSAATVIGAMIIAPLGTPIMGVAAGLVTRLKTGSLTFVVAGALAVVLVGVAFSLVLPGSFDLEGDEQIVSRTSPALLDLVAAVATGLAGAVALARRDVASVLPGVAIAISLVPPLAVVGICWGSGAGSLAFGALMLFASNLLSMILAGTLVFTALGYAGEADRHADGPSRRAKVTVALLLTVVSVPLLLNTAVAVLLAGWESDAEDAVEAWLADVPDAEVVDTDLAGGAVRVTVRSADPLPPTTELRRRLASLPEGLDVAVVRTPGRTITLQR